MTWVLQWDLNYAIFYFLNYLTSQFYGWLCLYLYISVYVSIVFSKFDNVGWKVMESIKKNETIKMLNSQDEVWWHESSLEFGGTQCFSFIMSCQVGLWGPFNNEGAGGGVGAAGESCCSSLSHRERQKRREKQSWQHLSIHFSASFVHPVNNYLQSLTQSFASHCLSLSKDMVCCHTVKATFCQEWWLVGKSEQKPPLSSWGDTTKAWCFVLGFGQPKQKIKAEAIKYL